MGRQQILDFPFAQESFGARGPEQASTATQPTVALASDRPMQFRPHRPIEPPSDARNSTLAQRNVCGTDNHRGGTNRQDDADAA